MIDDNPVDRALMSKILAKHDFNVLLSEDGPNGLKMAQEQTPDLIILDILLPGISGIELCKKLKNSPMTHDIPVIFYTSTDTPKHLIDYASCGARDYFQKTMPQEELIAAVKDILK